MVTVLCGYIVGTVVCAANTFVPVYRQGSENAVADCLSRAYDENTSPTDCVQSPSVSCSFDDDDTRDLDDAPI